jgi:hypothetical protein
VTFRKTVPRSGRTVARRPADTRALRSRQWRRLFRNIYVSSDVPLDHPNSGVGADLFWTGAARSKYTAVRGTVIATVRARGYDADAR